MKNKKKSKSCGRESWLTLTTLTTFELFNIIFTTIHLNLFLEYLPKLCINKQHFIIS